MLYNALQEKPLAYEEKKNAVSGISYDEVTSD